MDRTATKRRLNKRLKSVEEAIKPVDEQDDRLPTRVGAGEASLPKIDGRSFEARRVNEVYKGILSDLGGAEHVTEVQDALAKQMASLIAVGEDVAAQRIVGADSYDLQQHILLIKAMAPLARLIGTKRQVVEADEIELDDFLVKPSDD